MLEFGLRLLSRVAALVVFSTSAGVFAATPAESAANCPEQQGMGAVRFDRFSPNAQKLDETARAFNARFRNLTMKQFQEIVRRKDLRNAEKRLARAAVALQIERACRVGQVVAETSALGELLSTTRFSEISPTGPKFARAQVFLATSYAILAVVGSGVANESDLRSLYAPFESSIPLGSLPIRKSVDTQVSIKTCAQRHLGAVASKLATPEYPETARSAGAHGTALIRVTLDLEGRNIGESVYRSSGNQSLDHAALLAARASLYKPATENCRPVGGSYIFSATFQ